MKTKSLPQQTADSVKSNPAKPIPISGTTQPTGLIKLLELYKTRTRWVYLVVPNFCGSLFLRTGDFFSLLRKLIFATRTHWFFSLRINFCEFQKVPSTFPASRGLSQRGKNERKNERPLLAGNQYPALIIFSFLIITCHQGAIEIHIFKQYYG